MISPVLPPDEADRLRALRGYAVLDSVPEQTLDDLTSLAAHICGAPISLISLIDEDRDWFKSRHGLALAEIPRASSFSAQAILGDGVMVVDDLRQDSRFSANPLVTGEPRAVFCACAPLVTPDGFAIGALCVLDRKPRLLDAEQREALATLSRQVVIQLELRRRTTELGESEAQLLSVFRNTPVALAIHRWRDRTFVDVNDEFVRLLGWEAAELVGRTTQEMGIADEVRSSALRARLGAGAQIHGDEMVVRHKDGSSRSVLVASQLVDLAREKHAITTFFDVTERRLAEDARAVTEARYQTLFHYAPDGILIADQQSYYLDANESICRMLGYTREEFIGLHARDIVAPSEAPMIGEALRRLGNFEDYHREWVFKRKDGTTFTAEVMASQMPDGNLLAVVRDSTERKKLEQQVLRAQRMESIGTLAGGIAHDLNNVLAPILLSVEILTEMVDSEEALPFLDTLKSSAEHGASLVRQVLSFARGVQGHSIPVSMKHLMNDLGKFLRDTFPKAIDVRFESGAELWTVTGDPTQLHQLFLNMFVNARDAMPSGGKLSVIMENVVIDQTYASMHIDAKPGSYVVVTIADTGTGIAPDLQDRVFEPFFTTKETGSGTGLGLSTSLAIVRSHGGFIHLYSEPGNGSRFKIYLPANTADTVDADIAVEQARLPRGNGELVLVVDDEPAIRTIVQATLERFGYRSLLAVNGAEAIALYAQHKGEISVVLTDMAMPVMDGPATIVALKAINPAVKIIGSSGLVTDSGLAKAVGAGVHHFMPKPYTAEVILTTLRKILQEG